MNKKLGILLGAVAAVMVALAGLWYYIQQESFMSAAGSTVSQVASDALGVQVDVGAIKVDSLHSVEIENIAIYDKQAERIATADKAVVEYRLLSALSESPVDTVKTVTLKGVRATIENRSDGSWNYEDLLSDEESTTEFHGKINIEDAELTARYDGTELTLTDVNGELDMADYPAMAFTVTAMSNGTALAADGTVSADRQIVNAKLEGLDVKKYLDLIPAGTIPETVEIKAGELKSARVHIDRNSDELRLVGQAELTGGAVRVDSTDIEDIDVLTSFTEKEALINATATAAEQTATAHGKIKLAGSSTPYMDLQVETDAFDIGRILMDIPYSGAASLRAHVTGTFTNPAVTANVAVASGEAAGIPFTDAAADVRYMDGSVFVRELQATVFGGRVTGEGSLATSDLSYNAHLKTDGVSLTSVAEIFPAVSAVTGAVSADIGVTGVGTDMQALQAYGSAALTGGAYQALPIDSLTTSFSLAGDALTIDYLSANLPNHTNIGLEGSVQSLYTAPTLDMAFYGGHVDLSLLAKLDSRIDMTGLSDFKGTLTGLATNPQVEVKFSGLGGSIFKQPFDSLKFAASGSLDGIHIDDFLMENGGKETWRAAGSVGFTGAKNIDLQLDTMGARMEDIVALIAPDQPLTGNVDNIIKITGTLDDPEAVGYIHFYRGSYYGVLLSGMDGDYFLEDGVVRLQDFHAYSPMIDMVLNGTIDREQKLDMDIEARDIDLKRVEHKLPYTVEGHGTFRGKVVGTATDPEFYGILEAPELSMNEQKVTNLRGRLKYKKGSVDLDEFGFEQNGGTFDLMGSYDVATGAIRGDVVVQNADINAITAILNAKNDIVTGRLDSGIELGGTIENPRATLRGELTAGAVAGHDVHDVALELSLLNKILYINKLTGAQGPSGQIDATGYVDTTGGPMSVKFTATNLELAMFGAIAGLPDLVGTADITADISGYLRNPSADVTITGRDGGVHGSTFDTLDGVFSLKNGLVTVEKLNVAKAVGEKNYSVSASGIIPSRALMATKDESLNDIEQLHLTVSLDNADLSLLPTLSNHVDWAMGATRGTVSIRGTLAHPLVYGSIGLTGGAVKIKELEKPITDMVADVKFNGSQLTVSDISGKMGDGSYRITGGLTLDGTSPSVYDFSLVLDRLDIQSSFYRGPLNGTLRIENSEFFGKKMPKLSGELNFRDTTVSVPTIPDSEGDMPDMILDVSVNVGEKVHFYTAYLYDMYLTGAFHAGGLTTHPKMSGSLEVKRGGTINYLKTEFNIRQGVATFNQVASFLPSIDFFADTKLTQARVFLSAKGPLGDMELKLTSSPEMSQTQIIQMLTLRDAYKSGQTSMNAGDLLTVGLQMSFLSEIEGAMRDFLYLDQFTISRGSGSAFDSKSESSTDDADKYDFNIRMGKYIADRVMLKYTHGLSGDQINRIGIQYDINDRLGLTLDREGSDFIVGLEARTTF